MVDAYDISEYQGASTDFSILKNEIKFLIIRVQTGSSDEDILHDQFESEASANGIPYGVYAYANYLDVADAQVEAQDFWNRTNRDNAIFYVIDVEEVTTTNSADLIPATQAFINKLRDLGANKVGLYSGEYFFNSNGLSNVDCDFLWIAKYGNNDSTPDTEPDVGKPIDIWQFSSTYDSAGISENTVDANLHLGQAHALSYFTSGSTEEPTNTPPTTQDYSLSTSYMTPISGTIEASDADGDSLTFSLTSNPTHGSVDLQSNGSFTYTPNEEFLGADSFEVTVDDGNDGTAASTVSVTVAVPNVEAPTPSPLSPARFTEMFVVSDSASIYAERNTSSPKRATLSKWTSLWYQNNTSNNEFGYVKYINDRNITYWGFMQMESLKTQEEIEAERPTYEPEFHIVQDDETLTDIATQHGTTIEQLKILNGLRREVFLQVGQQVRYK